MKPLKNAIKPGKCNLKQVDICVAFKKWKSIKKEKDLRKIKMSSEVIEILDSDSDQTVTSEVISPKKKRRLAVPLSDDEEESEDASVKKIVHPKAKRPLKQDLPKVDDINNELTECTESENIGSPLFHSTPLSPSNIDINSNSYTIKETHLTQSGTSEDLSTNSGEDPDQTVVVEQNAQKRTVQIQQHIVIPACNFTAPISQCSNPVATQENSDKAGENDRCNRTRTVEKTSDNASNSTPTVTTPQKNCALTENIVQKASTSSCLSKDKPTPEKTGENRAKKNNLKSSPKKVTPVKTEKKEINKQSLTLIKDLFKTVFSSKQVSNLSESERKLIKLFLDMNDQYQYTCSKLITWQRKWYNSFKFCKLIKLYLEETEVCNMMNKFEDYGIIETNYMNESVTSLLHHLARPDLKYICDKFRLNKNLTTKETMIAALLKYTSTQSTLSVRRTAKDVLLEEIRNRMGRCIRVSKEFQDAFFSTYILGTFTNPDCTNIQDFFTNVLFHKVMPPEFPVDDYVIFGSRNDFLSYVQARKYRDELEKLTDPLESLQICKTIFTELKALETNNNDEERFREAPHLIRFTAKAVYVSTLSFMTERLYCKFPHEVRPWLEYMIKKVDCPHKIGHWYYHLAWLHMRYLQPFDYDHAARLLIEVLHRKRQHLSEVQLYMLRERGRQLTHTNKYKILPVNHDCIVQVSPKPLRVKDFPETTIDAKAIRSNDLGKKRNYEIRDELGNRTFMKVEDIALKHYVEKLGYTDGEHCEGNYIRALFTLFFFDVIYSPKRVIPGTFVSKIQNVPLDMNSRYFYTNRKEEIDRRVKEIEIEWSQEKLLKFVKLQYEKHSHEYAVCEVGGVIRDVEFLQVLVECIGRRVLAKIFERLVKNFREYRSGLPDLLVWNVDRKECKFVEVKGENDKLSIGQTLWLDYLLKIGANIEVCHVHSIGSKRKVKKVKCKASEEPSTSSRPD